MTHGIRTQAPSRRYPITLVTAYFALERKDRSVSDYHKWMGNFLPFVRWPLVIFCDEQSLETVKRLRGQKPTVYLVTDYREFHAYQYREKIRSSPFNIPIEVLMIWHEKPNFLRRAIEMNPFASEMFFWTDIGSYRVERHRAFFALSERIEWPDFRICRAMFHDKVGLFGVVDPRESPPENLGNIHGQFYGGGVAPVLRFCDLYYRCLERRCSQDKPIRSDEELLMDVYSARPDAARLLQINDLCWWLQGKDFSRPFHHWYCLSGGGFPWGYFCKRFLEHPGLLIKAVSVVTSKMR